MNSVHITKSDNHFFLVTIKEHSSEKYSRLRYDINVSPVPSIGDDKIPTDEDIKCLHIEIKVKKGNKIAHIHQLNHDKRCSLRSPDDNGLEKGTGTFEMVMSTLSLCRGLFGVSSFTLEDASLFNCKPAYTTVQLRLHNLLVHGESYYERRFKAQPRYSSDVLKWEKAKQDLKGIVSKDYSELIYEGVIERLEEEYIEPLMKVVLHHQGKSTWNEMFHRINNLNDSCIYFTNRVLGVLLGCTRIEIPEFIDFVIDISDTEVTRYLKQHELIHF